MTDIDPAIEVTLSDLLVIRAALNAAWHQNTVLDIHDSYRKMRTTSTPSALTKTLEGSVAITDAYIASQQEQDNAE